MRLGVIFYDQFEMLDAYGPLEMFGSLGDALEIVSIAEHAGPVRPLKGPATLAEYGFEDAPELDLVLIPGGVGTFPELSNEAFIDFLKARCPSSQITMSVCTGSALLAKAGLLDNLPATSNKMYFSLAEQQGCEVKWITSARWVDAGQYVTSSGVSAGTDMALAVIARIWGQEKAEAVARYTEYQWHRDANSDPFTEFLNKAEQIGT